jgi:hypothetical protein
MGGKNLDLNGYSNDTEAGVYRQRAILWQKKMYKCCLQRRSVQESYCPQDDCNLLKTNISNDDSSYCASDVDLPRLQQRRQLT